MKQCTLVFSTEAAAIILNTDWVAGNERSLRSCGSEERRRLELWKLCGPPPSARKAQVLFAHGLDGSNRGQLGSHDSPVLSAHYHWSS